jgi:hypothetical protein
MLERDFASESEREKGVQRERESKRECVSLAVRESE